jgi:Protein of unknown function (DUF3313)
MNRMKLTLVVALLGFVGGCSSTYQAKHVQPSDFLKPHHLKLMKAPQGDVLQTYKNPNVEWAKYRKIMLKPVVVWDGFSSRLTSDQRQDLQRLADAFYAKLYRKLSRDYEMIEQPASDAMLIQVAITHAEKSWVAPALLSKVSLELQVLNTVWTYFSGKPAFAGEMTFEFTVHDAQTAELLVAGADRRVGGQNLIDKELFSAWGDARNSVEFWSDLSAYQFCVLRRAGGCIQPKA